MQSAFQSICWCYLLSPLVTYRALRVALQFATPGHLPAFRGQSFDCFANINERRFDASDKSRPRLCHRNAPRRAREQRGAEPVLYAAHGVTDRRLLPLRGSALRTRMKKLRLLLAPAALSYSVTV